MDYIFLQKAHSGWAYISIILLLFSATNGVLGILLKKEFASLDRKVSLFGMVSVHIQLVLGIVLYFISPVGFASLGQMSDKVLRLTSLEHPLINLIAITCITIGWSKHKKSLDSLSKYKSIGIFYTIGLFLILSRIPWDLWL